MPQLKDRRFAATLGFSAAAWSVEILKKDPPLGQMKTGAPVYVDDGTCPKGQVNEVSAGAYAGAGKTQRETAAQRTRRCVPRPS